MITSEIQERPQPRLPASPGRIRNRCSQSPYVYSRQGHLEGTPVCGVAVPNTVRHLVKPKTRFSRGLRNKRSAGNQAGSPLWKQCHLRAPHQRPLTRARWLVDPGIDRPVWVIRARGLAGNINDSSRRKQSG